MIPLESILLLVPVMIAASLSPGPNILYILSNSATAQKRTGVIAATGIMTGLLVHVLLVAFGLGELFEHFPLAFTIMKYIGAAYLIYLAINIIRSKTKKENIHTNTRKPYLKIYSRGVLTCVLNPKAIVFFTAILPQFVDKTYGDIQMQLFVIAFTTVIIGYSMHIMLAIGTHYGSKRIMTKNTTFIKVQKYVLASLFGALAIKLAASSN